MASQVIELYPDAPERQDRFVAGVLEPVGAAYAELLRSVAPGGPGRVGQ